MPLSNFKFRRILCNKKLTLFKGVNYDYRNFHIFLPTSKTLDGEDIT